MCLWKGRKAGPLGAGAAQLAVGMSSPRPGICKEPRVREGHGAGLPHGHRVSCLGPEGPRGSPGRTVKRWPGNVRRLLCEPAWHRCKNGAAATWWAIGAIVASGRSLLVAPAARGDGVERGLAACLGRAMGPAGAAQGRGPHPQTPAGLRRPQGCPVPWGALLLLPVLLLALRPHKLIGPDRGKRSPPTARRFQRPQLTGHCHWLRKQDKAEV